MADALDRPVFIVGTGRCGSSVFQRVLAEHPHLTFLTFLNARYPDSLSLHRWYYRLRRCPVVGRYLRRRVPAGEPWPLWDRLMTGGSIAPAFSNSCRDLRANDVTPPMKERLRDGLPRYLIAGRPRLLVKFTGWPRIGFIKEVWPDAKIIHFAREPHAVVNSLINVYFWRGWMGPAHWQWGLLDKEEQALWDRFDRSFVVLAAIQWKKNLEAYHQAVAALPDAMRRDIHEVYYHDLCDRRDEVLSRVLEFCGLEDSPAFRSSVAQYRLVSRDDKWRRELTPKQQSELDAALEDLQWRKYYPAPS